MAPLAASTPLRMEPAWGDYYPRHHCRPLSFIENLVARTFALDVAKPKLAKVHASKCKIRYQLSTPLLEPTSSRVDEDRAPSSLHQVTS